MSTPVPSTTKPIIDSSDSERTPKLQRRSSASSIGSARSTRSNRSRSSTGSQRRRHIVVSNNRRILILALRYIISQKEYATLRKKVLLKGPLSISTNTPTRAEFDAVVRAATWDDFVPASMRAGLRVFLVCQGVGNGWEFMRERMRSRKEGTRPPTLRSALWNHSNFLSSLSLSTLIVAHRLLYRFFYQLRSNLQLLEALQFRTKYPNASKLFLSPKSPSLAASLAGFALLLHPATDRRVSIAVYALIKALEFLYNQYEDAGYFINRPWWFGSHLLFPLTSGQLFYSFIFSPPSLPSSYTSLLTSLSEDYLSPLPPSLPPSAPWPSPTTILSALPTIASLRFPPFSSPILIPTSTLPPSLSTISPLISPAHPSIKSLQCALLHPRDPSCLRSYISHLATSLPRIGKLIAVIYTIAWIPRYRKFLTSPGSSALKIAGSTALSSAFLTGTIGSLWGACCLLQSLLPRSAIPKGRFWLAGFLAGLWAFVDKEGNRANFLYAARIGLLSFWKMLKREAGVKGLKNGDVILFVLALGVVDCVYDSTPEAVSGGAARRVLASLRGRGLRDYIFERRRKERERAEKEAAEMEESEESVEAVEAVVAAEKKMKVLERQGVMTAATTVDFGRTVDFSRSAPVTREMVSPGGKLSPTQRRASLHVAPEVAAAIEAEVMAEIMRVQKVKEQTDEKKAEEKAERSESESIQTAPESPVMVSPPPEAEVEKPVSVKSRPVSIVESASITEQIAESVTESTTVTESAQIPEAEPVVEEEKVEEKIEEEKPAENKPVESTPVIESATVPDAEKATDMENVDEQAEEEIEDEEAVEEDEEEEEPTELVEPVSPTTSSKSTRSSLESVREEPEEEDDELEAAVLNQAENVEAEAVVEAATEKEEKEEIVEEKDASVIEKAEEKSEEKKEADEKAEAEPATAEVIEATVSGTAAPASVEKAEAKPEVKMGEEVKAEAEAETKA
ncbi:hypothetical protein FPQ18DRAFT_100344 [Pyronema domesticum]|nr:hypothetical protein FPQ18DRAFT_100344 [Pyronema domesticum]